MSNVATAKQNIYDRLANAPTFHPSSADIFTDWTLQGGDVVKINSGSDSYDVPVYGLRIKWSGVPKVSVQSSGNENRGSIDAMAQRYASSQRNQYYGGIRSKKRSDGLYSFINDTTSAIRIEVGNTQSQIRAFIETTPEMIHAEVGSAVSGFAQSVIEQTATYIRMEVENAASEISHSVIEQTTEYVRTEVSTVASGVAWSVVTQTMTNIQQQIARKSKVYMQWTDPNDGENVLYEGDIWIQADTNKTWGANSTYSWDSQASKQWRAKYGDLYRVWKNGMWILSVDTSRDVENSVEIEHTNKVYAINAKAKDLEGQEYNSRLEVTAREIRSSVSTAKSQLYSVISQTATNIRAIVANEVEGLQSSIEQTANSITTSVSAAKSSLYSVIVQTSTQIIQKVANDIDDVQAAITVESNRISLVVEGTGANAKIKPAEIVASINDGASNIRISANHIVLDGYVKATDITANLISSKISLISTITAQAIEADSVKIRPVSGMGLVNVATAYNGSSLTQSGNTYTLRLAKMNGNYDEYSFSRAVAYVDWSLSNGTLKVTPQPQNQEFTLGSLTDYRIFSHSAQAVPSGFVHSTNGYYITPNQGSKATVRIYSGADMTIGGKVIYSTSCNKDDYLETVPTNVYRDGYGTGYNTGYDANHSLFIGDANATAEPGVVNVAVGTPVEVWAYFKKTDDNYQYSSKYTFSAVDPYPNSMGITRAPAYKNSSGNYEYYGKLYYYDNTSNVYRAASDSDHYWYYSGTNKSGSTTVHY